MDLKCKPKISIIIPICNVDRFLKQTLSSAVNQTFKEIEIICVEDCSTDTSAEILKGVAASDLRVRCIYHTENIGAGLSRKEAIRTASGEFIMFIDGDDYLDVNACEHLYREISDSGVDILQFGANIIPADNVDSKELAAAESFFGMPYLAVVEQTKKGLLADYSFRQKKFGFNLWNKIFRSDIVKKAAEHFVEERFDLAEDLYLFFLISFYAETYKGIPERYYNYRLGVGITGGKRPLTEKRFIDIVKQGRVLRHMEDFSAENGTAESTAAGIGALREDFLSSAVWNWIWNGDVLDRPKAMKHILSYYDQLDVLEKLIQYYQQVDDNQKRAVVDGCKGTAIWSVVANVYAESQRRIELSDWIRELEKAKAYLEQQTANKDARIAELESWNRDVEDAKVYLEQQVGSKDARIAELENWNRDVEDAKAYLEQQVGSKDARIAELESWNQDVEDAKIYLEQQVVNKDARIAELESWTQELEKARDYLKEQWDKEILCREQLQKTLDEQGEVLADKDNTIAKQKYKLNLLLSDQKIQKIISKKQYEV